MNIETWKEIVGISDPHNSSYYYYISSQGRVKEVHIGWGDTDKEKILEPSNTGTVKVTNKDGKRKTLQLDKLMIEYFPPKFNIVWRKLDTNISTPKLYLFNPERTACKIEEPIKESLTTTLPREVKNKYKYNKFPPVELIDTMLKEGIKDTSDGYSYIEWNNYGAYEHRLVVMNFYKVDKLRNIVHVHHINYNKLDNSINNLILIPSRPHFRLHRYNRSNQVDKVLDIIDFYKNKQLELVKKDVEQIKWN